MARQANRDSFVFTDTTPQLSDVDRSTRTGVRGRLENAVLADADVEDLRISVFGGPVLRDDDRVHRDVRLPREHWKVIAFRAGRRLRARAILLTQDLDELGVLELEEFRVFEVSLAELEERTGLVLPAVLRDAQPPFLLAAPERRRPPASTADIRW